MIVKENEIEKLVKAIKEDNLVIFPTETVYGIGANAISENAVKKIFEAKGRKTDNPLIVHISDFKMLDMLVTNVNNIEKKLMEEFWPGPFTIILEKKDVIPYIVTSGLDTVAVRMPSNKIANKLIKLCGLPIAAPSANISGRPSGTNVEDIKEELESKVEYILDGGKCDVGIESTVVRVIDDTAIILRPGYITKEDILKIYDKVEYDKHIFEKIEISEKVLSPGMKYNHYAPDTKCILVEYVEDRDNFDVITSYIKENIDKKVAVLCFSENIEKLNKENIKLIDIGSKENVKEISKNIFADLRKADKLNCDVILIEGVKKIGIGVAVMNRIVRACGYNFI